MPVQNRPFKQGWTVHEKKGAGEYGKYDTIHAVIVGAVKKGKPHTIYFSKKSYEEMDKPKFIQVRFNGTEVGFFPMSAEDAEREGNCYTVQFSGDDGTDNASRRAMLSARTVIDDYELRSGVYSASVLIDGSTHVILINKNDKPSQP